MALPEPIAGTPGLDGYAGWIAGLECAERNYTSPYIGGFDPPGHGKEVPAGLRAAAAATGVSSSGGGQAGQGAALFFMLVLRARAGLQPCTVADLRQVPLRMAR